MYNDICRASNSICSIRIGCPGRAWSHRHMPSKDVYVPRVSARTANRVTAFSYYPCCGEIRKIILSAIPKHPFRGTSIQQMDGRRCERKIKNVNQVRQKAKGTLGGKPK